MSAFRWTGTCARCHEPRELQTRYQHAARALCDECAARPAKPRTAPPPRDAVADDWSNWDRWEAEKRATLKREKRVSPLDRPLDAMLRALQRWPGEYRCSLDPSRWTAPCPICHDALTIRETYVGGPVDVRCATGCNERRIAQALADGPPEQKAGA